MASQKNFTEKLAEQLENTTKEKWNSMCEAANKTLPTGSRTFVLGCNSGTSNTDWSILYGSTNSNVGGFEDSTSRNELRSNTQNYNQYTKKNRTNCVSYRLSRTTGVGTKYATSGIFDRAGHQQYVLKTAVPENAV